MGSSKVDRNAQSAEDLNEEDAEVASKIWEEMGISHEDYIKLIFVYTQWNHV